MKNQNPDGGAPHLAAVIVATALWASHAMADVIASTDFTGRTVSGNTAGNITWTVGGIQDPGDLTWVLEGGGPTTTSLFDTANAQGHFAPDLNIEQARVDFNDRRPCSGI